MSDLSDIEIESPKSPAGSDASSSAPISDDFQASDSASEVSSAAVESESESDASDYGRRARTKHKKITKAPAYRKQTALVRKKEESEGEESEESDYDPSGKATGKKKKKIKVCACEFNMLEPETLDVIAE
jgi:hypothetical protein